MTITESAPDTTELEAIEPSQASAGTITRVLTTGDHKTIGRLYLAVSLLFLAAIGALGAIVGFERTDAADLAIFENGNEFFQAMSAYRLGLIFLVVLPLFVGLGTAIVPMQVGSPAIAFPRAAGAAFWTWLLGAGILAASFAVDGGIGGGDFDPTSLTILGLGIAAISLMLGSVCIATTVIALRSPGMSLQRVPLFAWSMVIASIVWLATLAVLISNLVVIYIDLRTGSTGIFGEARYDQINWLFSQPQVFAYAIPVLGIAGEIVPVMAQRRQKNYAAMLGLIGLFGFLGIGAFAQSNTTAELPDGLMVFVMSIAVLLPILGVLGGLSQTAASGIKNIRPTGALLLAELSVLVLLVSAVAAALRIEPLRFLFKLELFNTSVIDGIFNGVLWASVAAALAGCWYWSSKLFGRSLSEAPALLLGLGLGLGAVLLLVADFVSGLEDQPSVTLANANNGALDGLSSTVETMNMVGFIGALLVAVTALLMSLGIAGAAAGKSSADADPWGGHTLEWATASPPVVSNFDEPVAPVTSERPLLDLAEEAAE